MDSGKKFDAQLNEIVNMDELLDIHEKTRILL